MVLKNDIIDIVNDYKVKYPNEKSKLKRLDDFIINNDDLTDWNNFNGHVVVSSFVYNVILKKVLIIYHTTLKLKLAPGGHVDDDDSTLKSAAIRELAEETDISNYLYSTDLIDIDIHDIEENKKLNLPPHIHFDFRYIFIVDETNVKIDEAELSSYEWISLDEFKKLKYMGDIIDKFDDLIKKYKLTKYLYR